MNIAYKTLFSCAIFAVANFAHSIAQPVISFTDTNHQFGEIVEGTQAVHEFSFTNTGDQPLIISRVAASCGCTTPYWTKEPVMPGETGIIKASYNSKGRPGQFRKSITVVSNAQTPTNIVYIQGVVINRPPTEEEIAASAKAVVATTTMKTGKVEKSQTIPVEFEITNEGKAVLQFKSIRSNCNCVLFGPEFDRAIPSGETETVTLYYTPSETGNWIEVVDLSTSDVVNETLKLTINAEVVETLSEDGTVGTRRGF